MRLVRITEPDQTAGSAVGRSDARDSDVHASDVRDSHARDSDAHDSDVNDSDGGVDTPTVSRVRDLRPSYAHVVVGGGDAEAVEPLSAYQSFLRHAYVTGVTSLPVVVTIAAGIGAAMVLQTTMAPTPPSTELGRMLVVVVMREVAPLLTAILIAGQRGHAMALDLRHRGPNGGHEVPYRGARIAGTMAASCALAVYFALAGMLGAYLTSQALTVRTFDAVREGFHMELAWFDLPMFVAKTAGLGAIVAWLGTGETLGKLKAEEVAEASSRVFVRALLLGGIFSTGLTMLLYALAGAPAPP